MLLRAYPKSAITNFFQIEFAIGNLEKDLIKCQQITLWFFVWWTWSGNTEPYGNHTVTCIGYSDGTTTDTLFIHDTWDGHLYHGITFGNWGSVVATWVRP